jgi:hypothetical protein
LGVGIQFADEGIPIFFCGSCKLRDERFDQVATGIFKSGSAAEIRGIGFHERWIEIVLTNQKAQLIAQSKVSVARAVRSSMTIGTRLGREGHLRSGEGPELFDAADADSVGFAEGSIDGSSLGHTHLGASDERRCV